MKKTFVLLQLLQDLTYEGDTAEDRAKWLANVKSSVGDNGYTYSGEDCYDTEDFACDDMEFTDDATVYDFMGSAYEKESFYERDIVVFKHKATGDFYVLEHDDLGTF